MVIYAWNIPYIYLHSYQHMLGAIYFSIHWPYAYRAASPQTAWYSLRLCSRRDACTGGTFPYTGKTLPKALGGFTPHVAVVAWEGAPPSSS